ncbi:MAG: zinc finger protein [Haloechinothrix sp.]
MSTDVRWQEAEGRLHAYLLPAEPGARSSFRHPVRLGDSFNALGHTTPITITPADVDPHRKARRGPAPTCRECDIAARERIGVPLWGYEESEPDVRSQ